MSGIGTLIHSLGTRCSGRFRHQKRAHSSGGPRTWYSSYAEQWNFFWHQKRAHSRGGPRTWYSSYAEQWNFFPSWKSSRDSSVLQPFAWQLHQLHSLRPIYKVYTLRHEANTMDQNWQQVGLSFKLFLGWKLQSWSNFLSKQLLIRYHQAALAMCVQNTALWGATPNAILAMWRQ
jgi:hypothetical protein